MSSELLPFRFAAGSLAGAAHLAAGRNNQDAWALRTGAAGFAAVVCDGCGAAERSELGAQLGADLMASELITRATSADPGQAVADAAEAVLRTLAGLSERIAEQGWLEDRLLFTVVGALGGPAETVLFAWGDGVVVINGEVHRLGTFEGNAPPYLAYRLLGSEVEPTLLRRLPTSEVRSLLVGTDGLADFPEAASLAGDETLFLNRDGLRRRLWRSRRAGVLRDDATAILVRRWAEA